MSCKLKLAGYTHIYPNRNPTFTLTVKGASGNVATEDVVYMLNGLGIHTGVDIKSLVQTGSWICSQLGRRSESRAALALGAQWQASSSTQPPMVSRL